MASKKRAANGSKKGVARELNSDQRELLENHGWETVTGGAGEPWTEGVAIAGTFKGVRDSTFQQDDGEFAKLIDLDTENGPRTFRCPAVLANRVATLNEGDEVHITCNGKIRTGAGRQAWDFTVLTKRHSAPKRVQAEASPKKKAGRPKKGAK